MAACRCLWTASISLNPKVLTLILKPPLAACRCLWTALKHESQILTLILQPSSAASARAGLDGVASKRRSTNVQAWPGQAHLPARIRAIQTSQTAGSTHSAKECTCTCMHVLGIPVAQCPRGRPRFPACWKVLCCKPDKHSRGTGQSPGTLQQAGNVGSSPSLCYACLACSGAHQPLPFPPINLPGDLAVSQPCP